MVESTRNAAIEERIAEIGKALAELDEEDAAYLLERLASDIEFAKKTKRSR